MTDLQIARTIELKHINDIASQLGVSADQLEHYGKYKAKLPLTLIDDSKVANSNLVLVTAISPTPAGEGNSADEISTVLSYTFYYHGFL